MRISTLTPWEVVRSFCGSKSVPSVEGEWKLSKSPRTICGNLSLSHMSAVLAVFHIEVPQPVFFLFRRPLSYSPHFWGSSGGNWYLLCGSIWGFTQSPCTINLSRQTHHQFVLRGHMTFICNDETVSRQNLWVDLWRQWVTVLLVYCYPHGDQTGHSLKLAHASLHLTCPNAPAPRSFPFVQFSGTWGTVERIPRNKMFMNVANEKANLRESQTKGNKRSSFHICTSTHQTFMKRKQRKSLH